jgi:hypothetical protein
VVGDKPPMRPPISVEPMRRCRWCLARLGVEQLSCPNCDNQVILSEKGVTWTWVAVLSLVSLTVVGIVIAALVISVASVCNLSH